MLGAHFKQAYMEELAITCLLSGRSPIDARGSAFAVSKHIT